MATFLARLFIKNYQDVKNPTVRAAYGELGGIVGIILNLLLTTAKFFVGSLTGSISISADAVNNLSDAGSSIITLAGFKLAKKPADKDHPYGHGRIEYITALIVSFLILLMGFELLKSSIEKIREPSPVTYSNVALIILLVSIAAKLWLAFFNRSLGKCIESTATKAVVADSLSDFPLFQRPGRRLVRHCGCPVHFLVGHRYFERHHCPAFGQAPGKRIF